MVKKCISTLFETLLVIGEASRNISVIVKFFVSLNKIIHMAYITIIKLIFLQLTYTKLDITDIKYWKKNWLARRGNLGYGLRNRDESGHSSKFFKQQQHDTMVKSYNIDKIFENYKMYTLM